MTEELHHLLKEVYQDFNLPFPSGEKVLEIDRRLKLLDKLLDNTEPEKPDCLHAGILCTLSGERCYNTRGCYEQ